MMNVYTKNSYSVTHFREIICNQKVLDDIYLQYILNLKTRDISRDIAREKENFIIFHKNCFFSI